MGVLFPDGVGYYNTAHLQTAKRYSTIATVSGYPTVETTGGPFNDYWIKNYHTSYAKKALGDVYNAELYAAFRYKHISGVDNHSIFAFYDGATVQGHLRNDNGTLKAVSGATTLGSASFPLIPTTWQQIEVRFKVHNSSGIFQVKIDTVLAIDVTTGDTDYANSGLLNAFSLGGFPTGYYTYDGFTHIIIMDTQGSYCNTWLGNRRVQVFMPDAEGYYSQWSPSTGSDNSDTVDEIPPNETDYNESDAAGEKDTFTTGNVANASASVDAVIATVFCKTDDSGAASMKGLVRSNSIDGEGVEASVPSSYGYIDSPIYVDPNTAAPFTVTALNAAEKGYKRQA